MTKRTKRLALIALVSLLAVFAASIRYQHDLRADQEREADTIKRICTTQATAYAGILANLGLALEEAVNLQKHAHDPAVRAYYGRVAPALRATLDAQFKKPPHCGEKFEFTIQITGEKPRHVKTK